MKKFLFTLAALLMAGSAFASCLFTMDPFEIPADKIGKNVQIPIRAEFGEYVSAWQCDVDVPDGLAFVGVKKGETYPIMGIDEFGDEFECSPDINRNGTRFIVAVMAGNYSEDGELYGVCKWAPGTYENFLYFVVRADETYAGGQMQIHTQFSCGMDKRPEINDNRVDNTVVYSNDPVEVTVEQTETTAPAPTFSYDAETYTMTATCEGHEVELYANGEKVDNPYTVEQTDLEQEISFSAITLKNDEDNDSPETFYEENPVIVPAKPVVTPDLPGSIVIADPVAATGQFSVIYLPGDYDGEYTMTVTINGEEAEALSDGVYQAVEGENLVTVTITADGYNDKFASRTFNYHYPTTAPAPTFSYDAETFTMTATCEDHDVVLYANGTEVSNPYTVEQTTEEQEITFSAITLKNDEDNNSAETFYAENPVIVPALTPVTPPAMPSYTTSTDDEYFYITFALAEDAEEGTELVIYDENGQEVAENPVKIARPDYDETADPVYAHYSAVAVKDNQTSQTLYVNELVPQKEQVIVEPETLKGELKIGEANEEGKFTVTYEGEEEVTITIDQDFEQVRDAANTYKLPEYGTYHVVATAKAEGYKDLVAEGDVTWTKPAEPVQTAAPEVVTTPGDDAYTIEGKVKEGDPEAEVTIYVVTVDETTGEEVRTEVTNPYVVSRGAEDQTINIVVVAHIDGQTDGETAMSVLIPKKVEDPTAVSELMSGKTVAGVRYFNLAGQEMQEANGMTIVVTTYTDGTTSAVKVMK